ncbi:response regulator [Methylorubrum subtropicum]|uniref:response regulator n=1 Tax=Methylorubrum subtropicum TaxID=3138812 RepID=UPI00399C748E
MEGSGFRVLAAQSTEEALQIFRHAKFVDIIISDMRRPDGERAGIDLLKRLYDSNIYKPYIIYCSSSSPEQKTDLKARGAFGTTTNAKELLELVLQALKYKSVFD